jgi:hypothetical protein
MPYYIYRIGMLGVPSKLAEFSSFRDASTHAKALRAADAPGTPGRVKVLFADNELVAEDLLGQVREPGPSVAEDD